MRKLIPLLAAVFFLHQGTSSAFEEGDSCNPSFSGAAIDCGKAATSVTPVTLDSRRPTPSPAASGAGSSGPTKKYVPYNRLVTGSHGQPCVATGYVEEGATPRDENLTVDPNPLESNIPSTGNYNSILETYPPCPEQPRAPGQTPPVETPAMIAARYWERVPLPKPQPVIAPGRAITGKMAYLETRGEVARTYTNDTVFGRLEILARGAYTVDWGDGETSGPHGFEGKPWPDGGITHEYQNVGSYDVVVTERWTATWSLGGQSGVLRTLQTTGRIDDFPVEQIQAVIRR